MYWLLVLLFLSGQVFAQPWQWEVYQGDYYNPTGFPNTAVRIGDFNAGGRGEILAAVNFQVLVFSKDSASFHWLADTCTVPPGALGSDAYDLDGDGADEIIAVGNPFHAWKAVTSEPWTWEARDDLVAGFESTLSANHGVFGDFDQDGLLNAFYMSGDWSAEFELRERTSDGTWVTDTTFTSDNGISSGIYAGDFDHDGDRDFAIAPAFSDVPWFGGFGESTPEGIVWHVGLMSPSANFPGPTGGDVDGDGEWEGLYHIGYDPGYSLVETAPGGEFVQTTESHYLGTPGGMVFSNFRVNGQTVIGAVHNWLWGDPWPFNDSFECLMRSDSGWHGFYSGFESPMPYSGWQCASGNRADLNGDGLEEIISELIDNVYPNGTERSWVIWENSGTMDQDSFGYSIPSAEYLTRRFVSNADTFVGYPQIGDITGDGRAELAVIREVPEAVFYVYIFEMVGEIADTTFVLHPEWSEGLPITFRRIRLADIDNDGLAELIGRDQNNTWHAYFRRNGTWEEYENILPPVTDDEISFADADNDGDLDLFTPTSLYYSLSLNGANPEPGRTAVRRYTLSAYPNPFNGETTITYDVPRTGKVELTVYNLLGEEVEVLVRGTVEAGIHSAVWRPQVSSGIYFARLTTPPFSPPLKQGGGSVMRKIVYLR